MRAKLSLAALAIRAVPLRLAVRPSRPSSANRPRSLDAAIDPQVLAKVVPGISKAQVKALLGAPWRTVQYNDLDEVENEFWEYRGKDSHGTYRVHIEFDKQGIVVIVGKIPDTGSRG